jgi:hypothetical protein
MNGNTVDELPALGLEIHQRKVYSAGNYQLIDK